LAGNANLFCFSDEEGRKERRREVEDVIVRREEM
jgi:hypothetical protein